MKVPTWLASGLVALSLVACGGSDGGAKECSSELTYVGTAKPFVAQYCLGCHGERVAGDARMGAPVDVNLDDEAQLFSHGTHVYEYVKDGVMPPSGSPQPSAAERREFVAWTECSGVSESHDHGE